MSEASAEVERLRRRLERERAVRRELEAVAEASTSALYEKQQQLELLGRVAAAANESESVAEALAIALLAVCEHTGWPVGHVWLRSGDILSSGELWRLPAEPGAFAGFRDRTEGLDVAAGEGLGGAVLAAGTPVWIDDVGTDPIFLRGPEAIAVGLTSAFAFPVITGGEVVAVLEFFALGPAVRDPSFLDVMADIGRQLGRVFERVRDAERLQEANDELEAFAYVASHDLQEPLRTISGFTKLLARRYADRDDAEADEYVGYITDGVARMSALIDALLRYARTGREELHRAPVDVGGVLDDVRQSLHARLEETEATVRADGLPRVKADAGQLAQLLTNLLGNAVKFRRPEVAPVVSVSAARDEGAWRFAVTDNGIGIEPAEAERVFDVFQRLGGADGYEGTGIGLSICQKIVERHGGRIWVEPSGDGPGSRFQFTLPD